VTSLGVERLVVGRQFQQLQRPEERPQRLAAPDRVHDRRIVVRELGERRVQLIAQRPAAFDDLPLGAELAARHPGGT